MTEEIKCLQPLRISCFQLKSRKEGKKIIDEEDICPMKDKCKIKIGEPRLGVAYARKPEEVEVRND